MIKSIEKAIDILSVVAAGEGNPVAFGEIVRQTKLNKSTCAHILETLCAKGMIEQISRSKGYVIGIETHFLARYGADKDLINTCLPVLRWLREKTHSTIILAVMKQNRKYIINSIDWGNSLPQLKKESIHEDDIYRTATGRILLSCMFPQEINHFVEIYGLPKSRDWDNIVSIDVLNDELAKIRKANFALSAGGSIDAETERWGIGKGLLKGGSTVAALGVTGVNLKNEIPNAINNATKYLNKAVLEINRRLELLQ